MMWYKYGVFFMAIPFVVVVVIPLSPSAARANGL
jgi:hypothetical protein